MKPEGMHHQPGQRAGFTLIELVMVITILIALMVFAVPVMMRATGSSQENATARVVEAVTQAILAQRDVSSGHVLLLPDGSVVRRWDMDGDGRLDGYPERVFGSASAALAASITPTPYRGFYGDTGGTYDGIFLDTDTGEVRDAWGQVLRIRFPGDGEDPLRFGPRGFRVFSLGRDGIADTDDDITDVPASSP